MSFVIDVQKHYKPNKCKDHFKFYHSYVIDFTSLIRPFHVSSKQFYVRYSAVAVMMKFTGPTFHRHLMLLVH